jgi:hypothetical protein
LVLLWSKKLLQIFFLTTTKQLNAKKKLMCPKTTTHLKLYGWANVFSASKFPVCRIRVWFFFRNTYIEPEVVVFLRMYEFLVHHVFASWTLPVWFASLYKIKFSCDFFQENKKNIFFRLLITLLIHISLQPKSSNEKCLRVQNVIWKKYFIFLPAKKKHLPKKILGHV